MQFLCLKFCWNTPIYATTSSLLSPLVWWLGCWEVGRALSRYGKGQPSVLWWMEMQVGNNVINSLPCKLLLHHVHQTAEYVQSNGIWNWVLVTKLYGEFNLSTIYPISSILSPGPPSKRRLFVFPTNLHSSSTPLPEEELL